MKNPSAHDAIAIIKTLPAGNADQMRGKMEAYQAVQTLIDQSVPSASAALQVIANLPTGLTEDICDGQEEAYRAVESLFHEKPMIQVGDAPKGTGLFGSTPLLATHQNVTELHALIDTLRLENERLQRLVEDKAVNDAPQQDQQDTYIAQDLEDIADYISKKTTGLRSTADWVKAGAEIVEEVTKPFVQSIANMRARKSKNAPAPTEKNVSDVINEAAENNAPNIHEDPDLAIKVLFARIRKNPNGVMSQQNKDDLDAIVNAIQARADINMRKYSEEFTAVMEKLQNACDPKADASNKVQGIRKGLLFGMSIAQNMGKPEVAKAILHCADVHAPLQEEYSLTEAGYADEDIIEGRLMAGRVAREHYEYAVAQAIEKYAYELTPIQE